MDDREAKDLRRERNVLAKATLRKIRAEHRVMHEMLTEAGIPEDVAGDGVRTCLLGRVACLIGRYEYEPGD